MLARRDHESYCSRVLAVADFGPLMVHRKAKNQRHS